MPRHRSSAARQREEPRALRRGDLARAATFRIDLEYEGTRYSGWQEQRNARTVAGALRAALEEAAGPLLDLGGAGRTDAGVHALHQVAHARLERAADPARLLLDLNDRLPADVNVLSVERASERFHARHDAQSRAYVYQVARRRSAFAQRFAWWVREELDVEAMRGTLELVRGGHDFGAFCQDSPVAKGTRANVLGVEVAEDGALVLVRIEASHFLWRMVRRLVGALVRVGSGELPSEALRAALAAGSGSELAPRIAAWTAPGAGLFLERVRYPGDPPLGAARAVLSVPTVL
ncbi:MAG: tRNA pseudouridine(38-40) synthase TruA [Planctomycetes bacterium]|nr:tRNA pseudouridine(38-40) synthase TruA [Planctomycetota bacterium]